MKFMRYKHQNTIKPCIVHNNILYDISHIIPDIEPKHILKLQSISSYSQSEIEALPIITNKIERNQITSCIASPGKVIAIGMNYLDHLERINYLGGPHVLPDHFIFFQKSTSSVTGPYDPIYIPRNTNKLDYENELGVVIGSPAKYVSQADAHKHIAGYCIVNDAADRGLQFLKPGQFNMGKSSDSFCPIGPYIVTPDEIDTSNLKIQTKVNDKIVQDGSTTGLIFSIANIISKLSEFFTLHPGDIIATGTPKGTQLEEETLGNPTNFLKVNDRIHLSIEGLGYQENIILAD